MVRAMKFLERAAVLSVVFLTLSGIMPGVASGHTGTVYYGPLWPSGKDVRYGYESGFPFGAYRSRVANGDDQWSSIGGAAEPDFLATLPDGNYGQPQTPCARTSYTGAIYWRDLDYISSGVLGVTRICYFQSTIFSFSIEFDNDRTWYNGTGDAPDGFLFGIGAEMDFWSVATHEWGHVTGFIEGPNLDGHFPESSSLCPEDNGRHTMCPAIEIGTEMMRTLNTHDAHTFTNAY